MCGSICKALVNCSAAPLVLPSRFENDSKVEAMLGVVAVGFDRCREGFRRAQQIPAGYSCSATPAQLQRALNFGCRLWVCIEA